MDPRMFDWRKSGTGVALACVLAACGKYAPTGPISDELADASGSSQDANQSDRPMIRMFDNLPSPGQLIVRAGTVVEWTNMGANSHTVSNYSQGIEWEDTRVEPGENFVHVFEEPGEYGFICIDHLEVGYVTVVAADMDDDMMGDMDDMMDGMDDDMMP